LDKNGSSAPIKKENHLLTVSQGFSYGLKQGTTEKTSVSGLKLLP
jgi:hypothetical protein